VSALNKIQFVIEVSAQCLKKQQYLQDTIAQEIQDVLDREVSDSDIQFCQRINNKHSKKERGHRMKKH
jgi:mRNA-degrading endonuclease RelE of RelBE toxin-antitoxin system